MSDNNVTQFKRRLINEWPRQVYIADFGDGDGARPYAHIQHPDDTTPLYHRGDLHEAAVAQARAEGRREAETAIQEAILALDHSASVIAELENVLSYYDDEGQPAKAAAASLRALMEQEPTDDRA